MRHSLADELTDELLERIVDGRYPPGAALPPSRSSRAKLT